MDAHSSTPALLCHSPGADVEDSNLLKPHPTPKSSPESYTHQYSAINFNVNISSQTNLASSSSLNTPSPSVNYLPSKFSEPYGIHRRKGKQAETVLSAFARRESRTLRQPDLESDEEFTWRSCYSRQKSLNKDRWTRFKWVIFVANSLLTTWSLAGIIFCLLTWFNTWDSADVVVVGNRDELILSTFAAVLGFVSSIVGWAGILLNNRTFLSIYSVMLWVTFAFVVAPGYITFKRKNQNLEGKLDGQWSKTIGIRGRLRIQNQLRCCGFFNPFVEATVSQTCYSRSLLPGCRGRYLRFQRRTLTIWSTVSFSIVPVQLFVMVAALLCSNHITYRFGKGMIPKKYRLDSLSMSVIVESYIAQIGDQHGADLAAGVVQEWRCRSQLSRIDSAGLVAQPTRALSNNDEARTPRGHGVMKRT